MRGESGTGQGGNCTWKRVVCRQGEAKRQAQRERSRQDQRRAQVAVVDEAVRQPRLVDLMMPGLILHAQHQHARRPP